MFHAVIQRPRLSEMHFQSMASTSSWVSTPAGELGKRERVYDHVGGVCGPSLEVMYIISSTFHWLKLVR